MTGVSPTAITYWERGDTKNLRNEHLFALEKCTGYSARWIVTGKGPKLANESVSLNSDTLDTINLMNQLDPADRAMIEQMIVRLAIKQSDTSE